MKRIDLEQVDWDDFDNNHPAFDEIREGFVVHSSQSRTQLKHWYMPGWVGTEDLMVIYGAPGAGKSVFATDTACRLAASWDFDGFNDNLYRRRVLYIAAERSNQTKRRIDAFCQHHGGDRFDNLIVYEGRIDLTQPYALRRVVRAAYWLSLESDTEIDVVIIDTLSAAMSGSDSDPSTMAKVVENLVDVQRNGIGDGDGCQVIVVHHTPVSGEARMRGAGNLLGAADMTCHVTAKRGVHTAKIIKDNDSPEDTLPTMSFTMELVPLGELWGITTTAPVLVPIAAKEGVQDAKTARQPRAQREALETLRAAVAANDKHPVTEKQWRAAVYDAASNVADAAKRQRFQPL